MVQPELLAIVLLHALVSLIVWFSGGLLGTYGLECQVGVVAHDLTHGLNPAVPLLDYFDTFTGNYLTQGVIAAPFALLPIDTIVAVKIGALISNAVILVLAWLFLNRVGGRLPALVGTLALALGPPVLRHHSLAGPMYHYNELMFDFGMLVLWAEIVFGGRRSWGWFAGLGLVCGWGITNCYGSAPFVAVVLVLWWICDRELPRRPASLTFLPAFLAGLSPLLLKATIHDSYHQELGGLRDLGVHVAGRQGQTLVDLVQKLGRFVTGDYGGTLGFLDTLGPAWGHEAALRTGEVYSALTLSGIPLVLVLCWRALPAGVVGLLPGRRFAPSSEGASALARLLPTLLALSLLSAYLFSDLWLHSPNATSSMREDRFLPPLTAMLALNLGIVTGLARDRLGRVPALQGGRGRTLSVVLVLAGLSLGGVCLRAQLALADGEGLGDGVGLPYRGRCYAVEAYYAGEALRGDPQRGARLCAGFPESHHGDCYEGFAWSAGIERLTRGSLPGEPIRSVRPEVARTCEQLGEPWTRPCFVRLGWYIFSESLAREPLWPDRAAGAWRTCSSLADPRHRSWCAEGIGLIYADYFGQTPEKLSLVVPPGSVGGDRAPVARGIGSFFAWVYDDEQVIARRCAAYDFAEAGFVEACLAGSRATRELHGLPLPGGPVEPGRLAPLASTR